MTVPFLQAVQPSTVKVKVAQTVPFLNVRSSAIQLRVLPQFPAAVVGGVGVSVSKQQGVYSIALDVAKLQTSPTSSGSYLILWDDTAKQFSRVTIAQLKTLMGL